MGDITPNVDIANVLEHRRRELGISRRVLSERSGLSHATVNRILMGSGLDRTSIGTLQAMAKALELRVRLDVETLSRSMEFLERQAEAKAEAIVRMVQGTSALEAQAVDDETRRELKRQTLHKLLAGPAERLWSRL